VQSLEIINKKEYEKYNHFFQRMKVVLSPFDPNTADSVTFLRLGLPPWMAKNILKYRAERRQVPKARGLSRKSTD
jgi:hypothetical protein